MDIMTDHKYAQRIAALLKKAESTESDEEAQALSAKASALMIKYGIEQSTIDNARAASGKGRGDITSKTMWFPGSYRKGLVFGSYQIICAMGTMEARQSSRKHVDYLRIADPIDDRMGLYLFIYGYESDLDNVVLLITSIHLQAMNAVRRWWKNDVNFKSFCTAGEKRSMRRSYIEGFFVGASKKIKESKRRVLSEAGGSAELVLLARRESVDRWMAENLAPGKKARTHMVHSYAYDSGKSDGSRADVGNTRVANAKALA
jgi:hypothetical protein